MPQLSLYINREDVKKTEREYSSAFIRETLSKMGLPLDDLWPEDMVELTIAQKMALKTLLGKYGVNVISEGKEIKIYAETNLAAHWKTPRYILKQDLNEINPAKRLFFEMIIDYDSVFEDDNETTDK